MKNASLNAFIETARTAWGPLTSDLVAECSTSLARMLQASPSEDWLTGLIRDQPANQELYRDRVHGFVLLAHTEQAGLYRLPHDHGRSWVIYAVQHGEIEMGSYGRIEGPDGDVRLVKRGATILRAGDVQVYLPGDIHDTRCLSHSALLYRFTERDLKQEDRQEHRVTRYEERDGHWTPAASQ